jgi:peptidylprolyl isomerase
MELATKKTKSSGRLARGAASAVLLLTMGAAYGGTINMDQYPDGLYASFDTSKGTILVNLEMDKAPLTVTNFVGLAEGKMETSSRKGQPFYDGLTFHRVISKHNGDQQDFMVQGGDPEGTGRGGPGYRFADEFDPSLSFSKPGLLAMANAGAGTNGSQFFITLAPTTWLNNKHTIFGEVVAGQDVVGKIKQGDKITKLTIIRKGAKAEAFKADQAKFDGLVKSAKDKKAAANADKIKADQTKIAQLLPNAKQTKSGVWYVVEKEGSGDKPTRGKGVSVHYTGKLLDGTVFDSSVERREPLSFPVGVGQVIPGWDEAVLDMKVGEKRKVVIPPELGYGEEGYPGVIPQNAHLYFEMELLSIKK